MTTDQTTTNRNGLPTVDRPCPHWCELPAGHSWDSGVEGVEDIRGHGNTVGTIENGHMSVGLGNFETSLHGGPSTFTPVLIDVDGVPSGNELTTDQARKLASLLILAAEQVEAL